ncbi:hypothetical protein [Methylobacterium sp. MA0201]|uniref:hypothetical protein n=1 Tax=Methylobacterium alsaeris TaxID=3344826 RepID=UPI0037574F61
MQGVMDSFFNPALTKIILSSFVCGCFGGLVGHFINNEKSAALRSDNPDKTWFAYPSKPQSCLIGAGGAIAFLFFIAAIGGLNDFNTLNEYLRLISVSVIAGFGARSLLPRMVGNLEKQLSEVDNKVSRFGNQVEKIRDEAQSAVKSAQEAITQATNARLEAERQYNELRDTITLNNELIKACAKNTDPQDWGSQLKRAEDLARQGTATSALWINIARLQRFKISLDSAIVTLDMLLLKYENKELAKDHNFIAAYFNRACYHELRFLANSNAADRQLALADARACLNHAGDPAFEINQMRGDEDLSELVKTEEFISIVSAVTPPPAS